jgi:AcrR family transcriptional regulator
MRERLLNATIDSLVEFGYTGATVSRIAAKAGATRGAQVHHYRVKADLVTAAIQHLAETRSAQLASDIERLNRSDDLVGDLLDMLWDLHQGPVFVATVELWVAARTDPELRDHVGSFEPFVEANLVEYGKQITSGQAANPDFLFAAYTVMDAIRGLLISTWGLPKTNVGARWRRAKPLLRLMFSDATAAPGRG